MFVKPINPIGFIKVLKYDVLEKEEVIEGFQALIDDGIVWKLDRFYINMAVSLIEAGHCKKGGLNYERAI